ncbi:MAG: hypothetical protein HY718_07795, partial [Planctomycetes bacterium]|nr:hypothetical protein [Planctomycetota bacterium]
MAEQPVHFRRVLKPPGATPDQVERLRHALEQCVQRQAQLTAGPGGEGILRVQPGIEVTDEAFLIRHEPVAIEPLPRLSDPASLPTAGDLQPILVLAYCVAGGLEAAHRAGVVHGGFCPACVLRTGALWKITDLGIAGAFEDAMGNFKLLALRQGGREDSPTISGTWEWIPPNRSDADRIAGYVDLSLWGPGGGLPDGRSDLHALGVVLYELLAYCHPYLDPNLPAGGRAKYGMWEKYASLFEYIPLQRASPDRRWAKVLEAYEEHKRVLSSDEKQLVNLIRLINATADVRAAERIDTATKLREELARMDPDIPARISAEIAEHERRERAKALRAAVLREQEELRRLGGRLDAGELDSPAFDEIAAALAAVVQRVEQAWQASGLAVATSTGGEAAAARPPAAVTRPIEIEPFTQEADRLRGRLHERRTAVEQAARQLDEARRTLKQFDRQYDEALLKQSETHLEAVRSSRLANPSQLAAAGALAGEVKARRDQVSGGEQLVRGVREGLAANDHGRVRTLCEAIIALQYIREQMRDEARQTLSLLKVLEEAWLVEQSRPYRRLLVREEVTDAELEKLEKGIVAVAENLEKLTTIPETVAPRIASARSMVEDCLKHLGSRRGAAGSLASAQALLDSGRLDKVTLLRARALAESVVADRHSAAPQEEAARAILSRVASAEAIQLPITNLLDSALQWLTHAVSGGGPACPPSSVVGGGPSQIENRESAIGNRQPAIGSGGAGGEAPWAAWQDLDRVEEACEKVLSELAPQGGSADQVYLATNLRERAAEERSRIIQAARAELAAAQETCGPAAPLRSEHSGSKTGWAASAQAGAGSAPKAGRGRLSEARKTAERYGTFPEASIAQQAAALAEAVERAWEALRQSLRAQAAQARALYEADSVPEAKILAEQILHHPDADDDARLAAANLIAVIRMKTEKLEVAVRTSREDCHRAMELVATLDTPGSRTRQGAAEPPGASRASGEFDEAASLAGNALAILSQARGLKAGLDAQSQAALDIAACLVKELPDLKTAKQIADSDEIPDAVRIWEQILARQGPSCPPAQAGAAQARECIRQYVARQLAACQVRIGALRAAATTKYLEALAAHEEASPGAPPPLPGEALANLPKWLSEPLGGLYTWVRRCSVGRAPRGAPPADAWPAGHRIGSRYEIREFINRSSTGDTYRAVRCGPDPPARKGDQARVRLTVFPLSLPAAAGGERQEVALDTPGGSAAPCRVRDPGVSRVEAALMGAARPLTAV